MSRYDLLLRGGELVTPDGVVRADLAVAGGVIVELGPELAGGAGIELDVRGKHVFPGVVDAHVHFNEPGRTEWEGFASGTRALAAGGTTSFVDMPLNASPPTIDGPSFDRKLAAAQRSSLVDFAFWGGIVPGNLSRLPELAERGVVGFKAFMSDSGIADFAAADDLTLYEAMACAAQLGLPVAVHAENDTITKQLALRAAREGRRDARDWLAARPVVAEVEAIERAIVLAAAAGCTLHIVHVSSAAGVAAVAAARERGVDVSCETCPHYLVFTADDAERLGALAKCAPPLRDDAEREALWACIAGGTLPMVASDHSPSPPELKAGHFLDAWGGISGCQTVLTSLLTAGWAARTLSLTTIADVAAAFPARRFGLDGKGAIHPGSDADLVVVDLAWNGKLRADDLQYRHPHSPYIGMQLRGKVLQTFVRGTPVWDRGTIVSPPAGRLLRPR